MLKSKTQYYRMLDKNISVFKDTLRLSRTKYKDKTKFTKLHTSVYDDANTFISDPIIDKDKIVNVSFVKGGTVNTAYSLKTRKNRVAMLNFADAKKPGGWVECGAPTQEENMCRCTNLYDCLTEPKCYEGYYIPNNPLHTDDHLVESYTNALIYLEDVIIFKDDTTYDYVPLKMVDVITSPAPCGYFKNAEEIITYRAKGIIKAAYLHGVTDLVLGAWGCGAFGQDPSIVASSFANALMELPLIDHVCFAIKETEGISDDKNSTFNRFMSAFQKRCNGVSTK